MLLNRRFFCVLSSTLLLLGVQAYAVPAKMLNHEPFLPAGVDFVRSLDVDLYVGEVNRRQLGMQTGRVRMRFRDPDVDAFVGMAVGVHHFNQDMRIGDPDNGDTAGVMCNWGGVFGIVRGPHLWELDLMGTSLSSRLGFAPAIVGEHHLSAKVLFFHRTELNMFANDAILDADQGLYWMWTPWIGGSAGYRWFTSSHMNRSGPHIGIRFYFESPKIPFIFPSLG